MKRIITALLVLTFMLTMTVACGNDDEKNDTGSQANTSSVEEMTSEELEAWGDVQIQIETSSEGNTQTTVSDGSSTGSTASGTTSSDKDEGFLDWVPIK